MKKLTSKNRHDLVNRLTSGIASFKFRGRTYSLHHPSIKLLQRAKEIYDDTIWSNRFSSLLTEDDIESVLIKQGLWTLCNDIRIKSLSDQLDNHKVELYNSYCTNPDGTKRCKRLIANLKMLINQAFRHRHSLDQWTLDYYATHIMHRFIAMYTLYHNDKRVYSDMVDFRHVSAQLLDVAITIKNSYIFDDNTLRQLARNDPWKTLWSVGKPNPFMFHFLELTEEQKLLLVFSKMYENIGNSPTAPPDDVIDDDDALDGWLIVQSRENESNRVGQKVESALTPRQGNGNEVFLPVKNRSEAQKIEQLNTPDAKVIKKQRQGIIDTKGTVKDGELLDNILVKQLMTNRQFKGHLQNKG